MDTEARKILHYEHMNDCRSMGSIHPSSQSRKISIGVMAESKASSRSGPKKGDGPVVPNTERVTSKMGNINTGESKAVGGTTVSAKEKQIGGPKAVEGSWMSKSPTTEENHQANKTASLLVSSGGKKDEPHGKGCGAGVQFFSYQTLKFPSNNYKKFDGDTSRSSRKKGKKDGSAEERVEEFTFTTTPKVFETDKTKAEDKTPRTENSTENLRMKLCQILGTTSSPKTQDSGSHNCKKDKESSPLKPRLNQKGNDFVKSKQNSDTIETDSESPDHTRKRPVTRSRTRKKVSSQKQQGKGKSTIITREAEKHQEKSILSFEEKGIGGRDALPNDGSSVSLKKKSQEKNSKIGGHKLCFTESDTTDKLHQDTSKTDPPLYAGATFSLGNKMGGFGGFLADYHTNSPKTQKKEHKKELYQPQTANNTDQRVEHEVSENRNQQERRTISATQNDAKSQDEFQSPTFQFKTPTLSSPSPTPKTHQKANDVNSPASTERPRFSMRTMPNLSTFMASEPDFTTREQDKSHHMKEQKYSIRRKEKSLEKETEEQDGSSDSSYEERNIQGRRQGSGAKHTAERKSFTLKPVKRLCKHKGIKFNDTSPASVSSKEIEESDSMDEASEQTQDGFVRAVELFALELAKLKNKLNLMTSQKSSEILKSVAEDIHFQLQDVHSQIETDLGKLTNLNKSKRKRIETRFEDQQKQLRLIYDRFKEEVNLHLQDCRSTVEDLEADQIEIKGALEKQRVAHKKLISQVEESVDVQLNDAQKKITSTQQMARGKLLQLKQVITMCLKEGI